ncbi:hypothetical protein [Nonomuraea sp. NPDC049309]
MLDGVVDRARHHAFVAERPGRPESPERWQAKLDAWTRRLRALS